MDLAAGAEKMCLHLLPADRSDQDVLYFQSTIKARSPCGLPPLGQILLPSLFFFVIGSVSEKEISFLGPVPVSEMGLRGRDAQHAWKSIVKYFAAPQPEWSLCLPLCAGSLQRNWLAGRLGAFFNLCTSTIPN